MKLEDQFKKDEAIAEGWISTHPGTVLWIIAAVIVGGFIASFFF